MLGRALYWSSRAISYCWLNLWRGWNFTNREECAKPLEWGK